MKVKDFKQLILDTFDEGDDECEIVVSVSGSPMEIVGITNHAHYTKPGGLPFEIQIR